MTFNINDIHKKMQHRLELSKHPLCEKCIEDSMMYGAALHHEDNGHIPFDEAVKIICYLNPYTHKNGGFRQNLNIAELMLDSIKNGKV